MQELCAVELAICTGSFLYLVDLLSSVLYCKKQMHVEKVWVRECYFAGIAGQILQILPFTCLVEFQQNILNRSQEYQPHSLCRLL